MATFANAADEENGLLAGRANIDLNSGWRFMRCDVEGAEALAAKSGRQPREVDAAEIQKVLRAAGFEP